MPSRLPVALGVFDTGEVWITTYPSDGSAKIDITLRDEEDFCDLVSALVKFKESPVWRRNAKQ
jgi:hypothetical protein